jgi:hypothetical protein
MPVIATQMESARAETTSPDHPEGPLPGTRFGVVHEQALWGGAGRRTRGGRHVGPVARRSSHFPRRHAGEWLRQDEGHQGGRCGRSRQDEDEQGRLGHDRHAGAGRREHVRAANRRCEGSRRREEDGRRGKKDNQRREEGRRRRKEGQRRKEEYRELGSLRLW